MINLQNRIQKITKLCRRRVKQTFASDRKIDFIICGTQKGGTTALDEYLREHSEICMSDEKEVHFFDNEKYFKNGLPNYAAYHAYFSIKREHRVLGEATPNYMYWKPAPQRMFEYNKHLKIIVILRNPIERAYSHWNMENMRGADGLSFGEAINNEQERCKEALPLQHRVYSYVSRGFYLEQLKRLWVYFPKENVLVIRSEDLKEKPGITMNQVCEFIGVSPIRNVELKNVHARPYDSPISNKDKEFLKSVYCEEIRKLENELNWNCSDWLS